MHTNQSVCAFSLQMRRTNGKNFSFHCNGMHLSGIEIEMRLQNYKDVEAVLCQQLCHSFFFVVPLSIARGKLIFIANDFDISFGRDAIAIAPHDPTYNQFKLHCIALHCTAKNSLPEKYIFDRTFRCQTEILLHKTRLRAIDRLIIPPFFQEF